MSEEEAKAFLKKVGEDKKLQEKIKGADSEEKFFVVVKAAGFNFTKEEWLSVVPKATDGETLSDSELREVAGGSLLPTYEWPHHCFHACTLVGCLSIVGDCE